MTDHQIQATFRGKLGVDVGNRFSGLAPAAGSAPNLLEHVDKVTDAIRGLGAAFRGDATDLRALEILTALQVVAEAQVARYAEANARLLAAQQENERLTAARAEESAKHQGELTAGEVVDLDQVTTE